MQQILTPKGSRLVDRACIEEHKMTGLELMTTAASNATEAVNDRIPEHSRILISCGSGNNGGDGFAMAHMLSGQHSVVVVTDALIENLSPESLHHYRLSQQTEKSKNPVTFIQWSELDTNDSFTVVIDAILGAGGSSKLRDYLPERLAILNAFDAHHISIDVPTGVDALTGEVHDSSFKADLTIAMAGIKVGCLSAKGRAFSGEFVVVSIGAPTTVVASHASAVALEDLDVRLWLPPRDRRSSKFDFGRVLVVAGSTRMRGAAALAAESAMRIGSGLCVLATTDVHPLLPREVMTEVLEATPAGTIAASAKSVIEQQLDRATSLVVGPGIGTEDETLQMLADVLNAADPALPVVLDADGLRLLPMLNRDMSHIVLTPHEGEYQHILRLRKHLYSHCLPKELAQDLGCVIHKKGFPSVTTDGITDVWTLCGNAGMSTAGSGDVLSGMIGGLLAQGLSQLRATALAAYIHARAGDEAANELTQEYMLAGDIIRSMPRVLGA